MKGLTMKLLSQFNLGMYRTEYRFRVFAIEYENGFRLSSNITLVKGIKGKSPTYWTYAFMLTNSECTWSVIETHSFYNTYPSKRKAEYLANLYAFFKKCQERLLEFGGCQGDKGVQALLGKGIAIN
jgi:hypothetical protein